MEKLINLLPGEENLVPGVDLYKLKKYPYYGDILGNLEVKGDVLEPSVNGNILSTEGYLITPISAETPKATVKLHFEGTKAILDAIVPASPSQTVFVKGGFNLYNERSADLKITRIVPRNMFYPQPNVDSAVINIKINFDKFNIPNKQFFAKVVKRTFNYRRKTLLNSLQLGLNIDKEKAEDIIKSMGLPIDIRGEKLSIQQFIDLSNKLIECV